MAADTKQQSARQTHLYLWMTISNLRRHRTIRKVFGFRNWNSSTEETVQALWRCCNGLIIDFKKQKQKTGNNNITLLTKQYPNALQSSKVFLAATSLACINVAKHFKIMIHAHWHWLICNLVCHVKFLSGAISHPAILEDETFGNPQQLVSSDLMVKLRSSLSHVKL